MLTSVIAHLFLELTDSLKKIIFLAKTWYIHVTKLMRVELNNRRLAIGDARS